MTNGVPDSQESDEVLRQRVAALTQEVETLRQHSKALEQANAALEVTLSTGRAQWQAELAAQAIEKAAEELFGGSLMIHEARSRAGLLQIAQRLRHNAELPPNDHAVAVIGLARWVGRPASPSLEPAEA
ncbi:hypothetical protein [Vreelandella populi]|uniref:hypothetical protein n=2 Tax=Halomonadaceae TaxID=28256 RepID=UPI00200F4F17|nr:hypothetical protein [Halomonas populi]